MLECFLLPAARPNDRKTLCLVCSLPTHGHFGRVAKAMGSPRVGSNPTGVARMRAEYPDQLDYRT